MPQQEFNEANKWEEKSKNMEYGTHLEFRDHTKEKFSGMLKMIQMFWSSPNNDINPSSLMGSQ